MVTRTFQGADFTRKNTFSQNIKTIKGRMKILPFVIYRNNFPVLNQSGESHESHSQNTGNDKRYRGSLE